MKHGAHMRPLLGAALLGFSVVACSQAAAPGGELGLSEAPASGLSRGWQLMPPYRTGHGRIANPRDAMTQNASISFVPPSVKQTTGSTAPVVWRRSDDPMAGADTAFAGWLAASQRCDGLQPDEPGRALQLATVLRAVICRSSTVRQGDGLTTQARAALDLARGQTQPALSLSAGVDASRGEALGFAAALRVDWVLYDFGVADASTRQARQALEAVLDEQRTEVLTAGAQAAQLFAAAQAAIGRVDAAAQNLRVALENARVAEMRHGAGAATLSDKLLAQTAAAQAQLENARATSQSLTARGVLALAMGQPPDWAFELAAAEFDEAELPAAPNVGLLLDEARGRHPRIVAARSRLAEARSRGVAIEAGRWGSVNTSASTGRVRASSVDAVGGFTSAAIQWNIPLFFDRNALRSRLSDAQGQIEVRTVGIVDAERQVALQVWIEGQALTGELDSLRASRSVLDSAEAALQVASERFRQGVGGFSDVLSAQNAAANARFQWVESRANLARAQWRLAAAVGRFGVLAPTEN